MGVTPMRPSRPRNDSFRRGDDRRRSSPQPDDQDQDQNTYVPPPARSARDDYDDAPRRTSDSRRSRRVPPEDVDASDDVQHDPYQPRHAADPYDPGRNAARTGDPYQARDRGRRGQASETPSPRSDRPANARRRDDAAPLYRPITRPPEQRYGALNSSDDLARPDTQPVEADWQPAEQRPRRPGGRATPPAPRHPDPYARPEQGQVPNGRGYPPAQPAWSTRDPEPADQWQDDLAYDTDAMDDQPVRDDDRGSNGYAIDPDIDGAWRDDPLTDDPAGREVVDSPWAQDAPNQDPANGWDGREPTDDLSPGDDPRAMVFGAPERPSRRSSGRQDGFRPPVWGLSGYAWRFARRLTIPRTNRLLRFGASRVLPASSRARFAEMRLPQAEVDETLGQIRSLNDWAEAWTGTAQRFLGETRRGGDMTPVEAAHSRQLAALCYHVAAFFAFGDERLTRTSRSASTTLFGQSLGLLMPETRKVNVRWRSKTMPGYLTVPSWATGRRPLVVLMNGVTTSREELILWSDEFLAQGLAVLALDTPGFGEASALGPVSLDNDDITDGIFELAESDPGLDPTKVSLVGISLGGTMALRAAAQERRIAAVVAVTPPYEPARWLGASSPVSLAQMVPLFGGYDQLADFVLGLDMPTTLAEIQAQVLVFGAGHDLVVPPPEASRLAAALGDQATLVWFDDAGHALFDALPEWTREAAEWLAVVMDVTDAPIFTEQEQDDPLDESSSDDGPVADATGAAPDDDWIQPETGQAPPANPSPTMGRRPIAPRSQAAAADLPAPMVARPPEPEPYGADVFDATQAEERRAEQQRGYETGVFGPLGPAAARILADEPTPQPGSPDWGYHDGSQWTERDTGAPLADTPTRAAPSTSRLWQNADPPAARPATGFRPVMARPDDGPTESSSADPSASDTPTTEYLAPTSPSVGRGRTSEPFRTVPAGDAKPAQVARPAMATEPTDQSDSPTPETNAAPNRASDSTPSDAGDAAGEPATEPPAGAATEHSDSHAAFRPPAARPD